MSNFKTALVASGIIIMFGAFSMYYILSEKKDVVSKKTVNVAEVVQDKELKKKGKEETEGSKSSHIDIKEEDKKENTEKKTLEDHEAEKIYISLIDHIKVNDYQKAIDIAQNTLSTYKIPKTKMTNLENTLHDAKLLLENSNTDNKVKVLEKLNDASVLVVETLKLPKNVAIKTILLGEGIKYGDGVFPEVKTSNIEMYGGDVGINLIETETSKEKMVDLAFKTIGDLKYVHVVSFNIPNKQFPQVSYVLEYNNGTLKILNIYDFETDDERWDMKAMSKQ